MPHVLSTIRILRRRTNPSVTGAEINAADERVLSGCVFFSVLCCLIAVLEVRQTRPVLRKSRRFRLSIRLNIQGQIVVALFTPKSDAIYSRQMMARVARFAA